MSSMRGSVADPQSACLATGSGLDCQTNWKEKHVNRSYFENNCRAAAQSRYLGDSTVLLTPLGAARNGGIRMVADSSDRGIVPHLMIDGFWESWVSVWLMMELKRRGPGAKLINIGANCGYYSLLAAAVGAHVVSVEPNPVHCKNILDSALLSGLHERLRVVHAGCSDTPGTGVLSFNTGHSMNAFIERSAATQSAMDAHVISASSVRNSISVPLITADSEMADADILFMDTEGHEPFVWAGASQMRQKLGFCAAIEWSPHRYDDPSSFYRQIVDEGFAFKLIDDQGQEVAVSRDAMLSRELMVTIRRQGAAR